MAAKDMNERNERQPLLSGSDGSHQDDYNDRRPSVVFDPEGDPDDPYEWPKRFRWSIVLLLSFMATTVYVESTCAASKSY